MLRQIARVRMELRRASRQVLIVVRRKRLAQPVPPTKPHSLPTACSAMFSLADSRKSVALTELRVRTPFSAAAASTQGLVHLLQFNATKLRVLLPLWILRLQAPITSSEMTSFVPLKTHVMELPTAQPTAHA